MRELQFINQICYQNQNNKIESTLVLFFEIRFLRRQLDVSGVENHVEHLRQAVLIIPRQDFENDPWLTGLPQHFSVQGTNPLRFSGMHRGRELPGRKRSDREGRKGRVNLTSKFQHQFWSPSSVPPTRCNQELPLLFYSGSILTSLRPPTPAAAIPRDPALDSCFQRGESCEEGWPGWNITSASS